MLWVLAIIAAGCVLTLAVAASGWPHRVLYSWRRSRHVAGGANWGLIEPVYWAAATLAETDEHQARYGSMILAAERALHRSYGPPGQVLTYNLPDWREQTAADLSPEALDSDVQPDPYLDPIAAEHVSEYDPGWYYCGECGKAHLPEDSGPGVPSLAPPGPDPGPVYDMGYLSLPAEVQRDVERTWAASRLADTADITDARLLADVQADMRAREDGCLAFLAGFASACERVRLDLSASLA